VALQQSRALVVRAAAAAEFSPEGFGRRTLVETDRLRVVVAALEDGQQIPLHAPQLDLVMTIVDGIGQVMAGQNLHPVRAGDVIVVPAGETRGLRAIGGRLVAVNVVSPPPRAGDHSHSTTAWPAEEEAPDLAALILAEHAGLFPQLPRLGSLAAEAADLSEAEFRTRLREVLGFLRDGLLPHAAEEERSVYPAAEKLIRAVGGATRTMSIDHRFVGRMVEDLETLEQGPLSDTDRQLVRRLLYGLEALLEVHFTKENEVYVPLLNRLSADERKELHARLTGGEHGHSEGA
jgi:quercetin dioxygenase-like cupin family protein/iron-sulfur cluster repair protein YtfE (RIC family)